MTTEACNLIDFIRTADAAYVAWQADPTNHDLEWVYETAKLDMKAVFEAWESMVNEAVYGAEVAR